jgi:hypothetical protein
MQNNALVHHIKSRFNIVSSVDTSVLVQEWFLFWERKVGSDRLNIIILAGFGARFYLWQKVFFLQKCLLFLTGKNYRIRKNERHVGKNE